MSNPFKNLLMTGSIVAMSIASAFGQNKSDIKLSEELNTNSKYTSTLKQELDGSVTIQYQAIPTSLDDKSLESLTLNATDTSGNGIIEPGEVHDLSYENKDFSAQGLKNAQGNMYMLVRTGAISKELTAPGLHAIPFLKNVLPNLKEPPPLAVPEKTPSKQAPSKKKPLKP